MSKAKDCSLVMMAKTFDSEKGRKKRRYVYNDSEVQLAVAWFEGEITTDAVATVLECDRSNVNSRCIQAVKQGIQSGRLGFLWRSLGE